MFIGWIQEKSTLRITEKCKIKFSINVGYVDEVDLEVVPLMHVN